MNKPSAIVAAIFAAITSASVSATPTVTIDSVTQRWPWNNKVDIKYTISGGTDMSRYEYYKIKFNATIDGQTYEIDGSKDLIAKTVNGTHTVTWTNAPAGVRATGCTMGATLYETTGDYMIIDLDTGHFAFENLEGSDSRTITPEASNARYNTALYKTDRLVMRRVERTTAPNAAYASYPTGGDSYSNTRGTNPVLTFYNSAKNWTTDKDYFVGVFMVTVAQYRKITGLERQGAFNDWGGNVKDWCPAGVESYNTLRNSKTATTALSADASSVSFFERLNAKTGIGTGFDLPTEVMWEIAARAGTTTLYWWGASKVWADFVHRCVFSGTRVDDGNGNKTRSYNVGLKSSGAQRTSNRWGLFDTMGNLIELCRDVGYYPDLKDASDPFTPKYDSAATTSMCRGGYWEETENSRTFEASFRYPAPATIDKSNANYIGIRVFFVAQ